MNLLDFAKRMEKRADNLPKEAHEVVKTVAKTFFETAARLTPVDTSKAVSNWQIGVNSAPGNVLPAHFPGKAKSTREPSMARAIQLAYSKIDGSFPGDKLHIVNNTEYIKDLDSGNGSRQAPVGMTPLARISALMQLRGSKVINPHG